MSSSLINLVTSLLAKSIFKSSMSTNTSVTPFSGVFTSSVTPADLPWDTYNYCNAPHVSAKYYERPPQAKDARLVFVNVVQRHHKRTPDNLYPNENIFNPAAGWDCSNYQQISYSVGANQDANLQGHGIYRKIESPSWHPLNSIIWNGTCDQGMLTADGLRDSIQHGRDFWSVYGPYGKNPLLRQGINQRDVYFRTSNSDRTYQVSGGLLTGMNGWTSPGNFPVHTQPSNMDDIVPNYSCGYANGFRSYEQSLLAWNDHLSSKASLFAALNNVVGTASQSGWNSWIDHHFDAMASRQCHGHELPRNPATGQSISQDLANQAYNEGHWEYDYIWNSGAGADDYVKYGFGVFVQELSRSFKRFASGEDKYKMRYTVGHDGTMVRLYKSLGLAGQFKWPAMGSEVVMEVYEHKGQHFVRILKDGKTMQTVNKDLASDAQGNIAWTPLDKVTAYLDSRVPSDIYSKCVLGK
ncbi:related to acid phosphatase [Sporisorium reilianum f. sp. reilianum]|uniref:Related to acid phosphatase n=1 Tax=Sporisorium reilianum f. sp. reilianum TaxID=72559 RepID=A0A2N8UD25_9BASI|nr:related to acid phosphatase [Sporisorium reilianum f. sp. reilianum]